MKKIALIQLGAVNQNGSDITANINASLSEYDTQTILFSTIEELNADDFDALIIPGNSHLLQDLTTFNTDGERFKVHETIEKIILKFYQQSKPIGVIGIAAVVAAQVLKKNRPLITLGETSDFISKLNKMNIQHEKCPSTDYITDRDCKLLSTPADMNEVTSRSAYTGIRLMIKELVEMA
jgi:enhancing lycopene biosynthesis protein 2